MGTIVQGLLSRIRAWIFRARGMQISGPVWLRAVEVSKPHTVTLDAGAALDRGITLLATSETAKIVIGKRTYLNRHTIIDADVLVEIGDDTMIGPFCYLTDHDHPIQKDQLPSRGPLQSKPTRIGKKCWIGAHVTVLKGVTIGDGTVVGAGSVVTKSLPAGVVAVGNPARVLREIQDS